MKRVPLLLGGVALAGLLAACSSSPSTTTTTSASTTTTTAAATSTTAAGVQPDTTTTAASSAAALGHDFVTDAKPCNTIISKLSAYPASTPQDNPALDATASQLATCMENFDNQLLRLPFTGQTKADVRTLTRADSTFAIDLQQIATVDTTTFSHDEAAVLADDNIVRADLGLPPDK